MDFQFSFPRNFLPLPAFSSALLPFSAPSPLPLIKVGQSTGLLLSQRVRHFKHCTSPTTSLSLPSHSCKEQGGKANGSNDRRSEDEISLLR